MESCAISVVKWLRFLIALGQECHAWKTIAYEYFSCRLCVVLVMSTRDCFGKPREVFNNDYQSGVPRPGFTKI